MYVAFWVVVLDLSGTYDPRRIASGIEEYRGLFQGSLRLLGLVALTSYLGKFSLSRAFVGLSIGITFVLSVLARNVARKWLARRRTDGRFQDRLLIVGTNDSVANLVRHFQRASATQFTVIGAIIEDGGENLDVDGYSIPIVGSPGNLQGAFDSRQADAIAVADTSTLSAGQLRQFAWDLEGTGVDLLVVPAITDFAGPRVSVRPVAGLPLLHLEEPEFDGLTRFFKDALDRVLGSLLLVASAPLLAVIALAIRLDSPGGAIFAQKRVGKDGVEFTCWKFRTMHMGADDLKHDLFHQNEHHGVLFKIRHDPRRTRLGVWLRRTSMDELPQLLNVVVGDMSLVGPRPPVPQEVARYGHQIRRRLLVKPGLTGLWQVSGRSDLSWNEAVRLDLYYVENWSMALDMVILWRTAAAVLRGRGAY